MPTRGIQPSFAGGVLGPGLWGRVDLAKYDVALRLGVNCFIHAFGGVSNRSGFEFIAEVSDSSVEHILIPFERDDETNYVLEFGDTTMRVIKDGGMVLDTASAATITAISQADPCVVTATNTFSDGDQITIQNVVGMTEVNSQTYVVANRTASNFELNDLWGNGIDSTGFTAYTSGGTATPALNVTTSFSEAVVQTMDYAQSADVMYFSDRSLAPIKVSRTSDISWTFTAVNVDPQNAAPTGLTLTPSTSGSETYKYVVTSVDENGVESFPSSEVEDTNSVDLSTSGASMEISWTAATGAEEYNVYRERNGIFGFIGFTDGTSFTDENISPTLETTPPEAAGIFGSADNYPGAVTLVSQRLVFGGSNNDPETIWFSRTADFENFTKSRILAPADRIEVGLTGRSVNGIRQLLGLRELLAFGSRGEFTITGAQGFLSAVEPVVTQYGYTGAKKVKPVVVNDTALFVEPSGRVVRDLRYAFEQDGYTGNELSILAYHYFERRSVKQWAYAQSPHSIVWVVMDDGKLLSMTYKREHQVWAWTEHDFGDDVEIESVCSILENDRSAVYIIAKKTINSQEKRYILRQTDRNFSNVEDGVFVDFGSTYDGVAATVISGLEHLEGETVVALADGNVFDNLTVTNASVTLERSAEKVHVGKYNIAEFETLPPAVDLQGYGSGRGRPQKVNKVSLQCENTRGISVGPNKDLLVEWNQVKGPDLSDPIAMQTGFFSFNLKPDWSSDGTVFVRQVYPLPMTILAVAPDLTIGR